MSLYCRRMVFLIQLQELCFGKERGIEDGGGWTSGESAGEWHGDLRNHHPNKVNKPSFV
jgi:hypothetical protein